MDVTSTSGGRITGSVVGCGETDVVHDSIPVGKCAWVNQDGSLLVALLVDVKSASGGRITGPAVGCGATDVVQVFGFAAGVMGGCIGLGFVVGGVLSSGRVKSFLVEKLLYCFGALGPVEVG